MSETGDTTPVATRQECNGDTATKCRNYPCTKPEFHDGPCESPNDLHIGTTTVELMPDPPRMFAFSREDERLIAHALSYFATVRDDSIRNGLAVGEKIDAHHNVQAAQDRDRAIELSGRFR